MRPALVALAQVAGETPPALLSETHLIRVTSGWKARKLAQKTRHGYAIELRTVLRLLRPYGCPPLLGRLVPRTPQGPPRDVIATPQQRDLLLSRAHPALRLFLLLCHDAGLRTGTARLIAPCHWSPTDGKLIVVSKFGSRLRIAVTQRLGDLIRIAASGEPPDSKLPLCTLLYGRSRKPYSATTFTRWLVELRKECGVGQRITPHDLRRTTAVALYNDTHDLRVVQAFLGHRKPAHTLIYLGHFCNPLDAALVERVTKAVPLA